MTNAILLDAKDNVATCTTAALKGDTIKILGGNEIICAEDIPIWHKVALRPIAATRAPKSARCAGYETSCFITPAAAVRGGL